MIRLVTLAGKGRRVINPLELTDRDAGIWLLAQLRRENPGKTMAEIIGEPGRLGGWLTDLGRGVGNLKDGIGDVLKDAGHAGAEFGRYVFNSPPGRIIEDKARQKLGLEPVDRNLDAVLASLGANAKSLLGGLPGGALLWGGGAAALLILFLLVKK